jgi:hypothetical protein
MGGSKGGHLPQGLQRDCRDEGNDKALRENGCTVCEPYEPPPKIQKNKSDNES